MVSCQHCEKKSFLLIYSTVTCNLQSLKSESASKVERINCFCGNKCAGVVPAVQTCTFFFRDRNSLSRLLLFPIHLKSVVGGLSEEIQYQKLIFDSFSHLYFWLLESDVPGTLCSVTFLKHLIPFPIKTRQEESSRRKKISLEQIESIWGVFCCESGDDPEVIHELSLILSACFLRAQE